MGITHPSQGVAAMDSGCQIGGATFFTILTDLNTAPIPNRIGDVLLQCTGGKMYIASGATATSDWKLVTSA